MPKAPKALLARKEPPERKVRLEPPERRGQQALKARKVPRDQRVPKGRKGRKAT